MTQSVHLGGPIDRRCERTSWDLLSNILVARRETGGSLVDFHVAYLSGISVVDLICSMANMEVTSYIGSLSISLL